ncbi:hypothetical protein QDA04_gp84 [Microbacterium phage Megan]|uniref:Uncharacterized protein n=1 Tax=Microbacterium phage Megan TaxID=2656551 RepID=A0A649VKM8_9CAUD|nr:hypothetical protein QDA04_gp84 [Microbacterium phage Megan]QGJ92754.1 hypothetical protein PBI_MEGAN_84 [Microbacterium phage Megan]
MTCGATEARCVCVLDAEHDGPHVCDASCGGSWEGSEADGTFRIVLYPGGVASPLAALALAFGWDDDEEDEDG